MGLDLRLNQVNHDCVSHVLLRNVPEELVRRVKSKAALEGRTMREIVIGAFEQYAGGKEESKSTRGKAPRK